MNTDIVILVALVVDVDVLEAHQRVVVPVADRRPLVIGVARDDGHAITLEIVKSVLSH
jgi:hypothetical protein